MGNTGTRCLTLGTFALAFGAAAVVIGAAVWFMSGGDEPETASEGRELRSRKIAAAKADRKLRNGRIRDRRQKIEQVEVKAPPVKPDFLADLEEDKKMTAEMKKMFFELQAALDLEDARKVYALVRKLQLMDEWPDGIPRSVKLKALQALSWFGAAGMAEAVGFLADSDPEIRQTTLAEFEKMLADSWDLGDAKLSVVIKEVSKVVHDRDTLDTFYFELNNMRPTVRAETALAIYDSKNPDAISVLNDNLEFAFESAGEIKTRADVEQYLADAQQDYKDNPAKAAEDEEFYGPSRN